MNKLDNNFQILKSTGIIGINQIINILFGIFRIKIIAVLLGPIGVGLAGLLQSTIDIIRSSTNFGINISAVREIANSSGTKDIIKINRTIKIVKRWSVWTGLFGVVITIAFGKIIAKEVFDNQYDYIDITFLSITLLLGAISNARIAILQGLQDIKSMVKASIWGTIVSFFVTIPLYYFFNTKGIIPALVLMYCIGWIFTNYYTKKFSTTHIKLPVREIFSQGLSMIKLGSYILITTFISTLTLFIIRFYISFNSTIENVGFFQMSITLTSIYISTLLTALASDFFPRLSAVNKDDKELTRLVNQQTSIIVLLSFPLITLMILFLPQVILLLYSKNFLEATSLIEWQLLGMFFKIACSPVVYILLAKNKGWHFIIIESISNLIYILWMLFGWKYLYLNSLGIGFLSMYVFYLIGGFYFGKYHSNFSFTKSNVMLFATLIPLLLITFIIIHFKLTDNLLVKLTLAFSSLLIFIYFFNKLFGLKFLIHKFFPKIDLHEKNI